MSWDGAMNKAILISLAAVVVTIVIIAWAALRFLRADDADPFDEIPDEPRRPARAPEDARVRDAAPVTASARRAPGRPAPADDPARAGSRGPDRDQPDPRSRGDRARPDFDGGERGRPDRSPQDRPAADRRAGQSSSPSRPVPVAARAAKPARPADKSGEGPDWDTMSDVDYWAELAADKPFSTASDAPAAPVAAASGRRAAEAAAPRPADQAPLPTRQRSARPAASAGGRGP